MLVCATSEVATFPSPSLFEVLLEGEINGLRQRRTYTMLDEYDAATDTTSMARTTGYTCAMVARQVIGGLFTQKGISPPEYVGRTPGCWDHLMAGYSARNIHLNETIEELSSAG